MTNVIDPFTTIQLISTNNATVTFNLVVSGIGGYLTLLLSTTGSDPVLGSIIMASMTRCNNSS